MRATSGTDARSTVTALFRFVSSSVNHYHQIEDVGHAWVRIQDLLPDDRDQVVRELQLLVILEQDEAVDGDRGIRREEEPDLDLAARQRLDGQRSTGVERRELLEFQPVGLLETEQAERALGALGRAAEHEGRGDRWTAGCRRRRFAGRGFAGSGFTRRRRCACATPTRRAGAEKQRQHRRPESRSADAPHGSSLAVAFRTVLRQRHPGQAGNIPAGS
jgi:hypothetical protein